MELHYLPGSLVFLAWPSMVLWYWAWWQCSSSLPPGWEKRKRIRKNCDRMKAASSQQAQPASVTQFHFFLLPSFFSFSMWKQPTSFLGPSPTTDSVGLAGCKYPSLSSSCFLALFISGGREGSSGGQRRERIEQPPLAGG